MNRDMLDQRLSQITTMWTVLNQAHGGGGNCALAQQMLAERYRGAVYRYLLAALRDVSTAEDLTQEFALSLVRGDFRKASPERGRFRNYVKTVLFHLVGKHRQREQRRPQPVAPEHPHLRDQAAGEDDREFNDTWRADLLARAWNALQQSQSAFYEVLRLRADHPEMPSLQMAEVLSRQQGRPFSDDGVRQTMRRARRKFAELLFDEVAYSLDQPSPQLVEDELRELNLWTYCQPILSPKT